MSVLDLNLELLDKFLSEDLLITKPAIYIYIEKDKCDNVIQNGIALSNKTVKAYLNRLPENNGAYSDFLENNYPVQITMNRLKKIKDQDVDLEPQNIDMPNGSTKIDEDILSKLKKKYASYLNICYNDHIPIDEIPHINITFSKSFIPGFVCKVMKNNSFELGKNS